MTKETGDKREHPRLPVKIPVEYGNLIDFFADYALDISHGGMFISTDKKIEDGRKVTVRFKLPSERASFEATGVVVRMADRPSEGIGIKFDPLGEEAMSMINRLWEENMKK